MQDLTPYRHIVVIMVGLSAAVAGLIAFIAASQLAAKAEKTALDTSVIADEGNADARGRRPKRRTQPIPDLGLNVAKGKQFLWQCHFDSVPMDLQAIWGTSLKFDWWAAMSPHRGISR